MRKITILIATCILFIMPSCTKSNEDKAEELISKCLKENMSYPDSYEAISTKVDSSFVKVSTIIEILDLSEDVFSDISKIRAIKSDISSAQTTKEIYTPTGFYDSAHLTSSSCHPKFFVKEFCYFLMSCHQHCLGINLLVQR